MGRLLTVVAMVGVGLTASCGRYDVKDIDFTRAQFAAHRPEFEALADKVQRCGGLTYIRLRDREEWPCVGGGVTRAEIVTDLKRLKLKGVYWNADRSSVRIVNGEHDNGFLDVGVMSEMVRYSTPRDDADGYALTPPPHYWFYDQHD